MATAAPSIVGFVDEGLGHSSYLVDLGDGTALGDRPAPASPSSKRPTPHARGLRIAYTADTHTHADYVSGSPELAADGATLPRSRRPAGSSCRTTGLARRRRRRGRAASVLEAIATPGHTPDHLAYLLETDDGTGRAVHRRLADGRHRRAHRPARTRAREELAHAQFHCAAGPDPDPARRPAVYPTHGAGSFCSAPGGADRTTTIGRERAHNPLLADRRRGRRSSTRCSPASGRSPTYFRRLPEVNRRGPHVYGTSPAARRARRRRRSRAAVERGALVVDARPIDRLRRRPHPRVAVDRAAAGVRDLARLAHSTRPRPVVFVLDDDQDEPELVRQCLTIGHENLAGRARRRHRRLGRGRPARRVDRADRARRASIGPLLDVRQDNEFAAGHVPGARNVELGALATSTICPPGTVTVMCGHGERAMTGASVLERAGPRDVAVLARRPRRLGRARAGSALATGRMTPTRRARQADPARAAREPRPVRAARRRQRARRRDDRPGTHRPAAARRAASSGSPPSPPRSRSSSRSAR